MNQFEQTQIPQLESPQRSETRKEDESTEIVDSVLGNTRDDINEVLTIPEKNERLSVKEREKLFTEDILSHIPLEKYLELWKRGSPHFVSHVTRQGFRDHTSHTHGGDVGKFFSGFDNISESGIIGSPYYAMGLKDISETGVREFLQQNGILTAKSKEEAVKRYRELVSKDIDPYTKLPVYGNRASIHVATEYVSDDIYGAETGNEVFAIYPSDFIASQFYFSFNSGQKGFTRRPDSHDHNDVFVWSKRDLTTLSLDAGVIFLPKSTFVDQETGSQYKSYKNEKEFPERRIDGERVSRFMSWINDNHTVNEGSKNELVDGLISTFRINQELTEKTIKSFARNNGVSSYKYGSDGETLVKKEDQEILDIIASESTSEYQNAFWINLLYERPEQTVTAQQYWQKYFLQNFDKTPKHIIFYDGNPTNAVQQFMQENGIVSNGESSKLLDFEQNEIIDRKSDSRASKGFNEIDRFAMKTIEESYFAKTA